MKRFDEEIRAANNPKSNSFDTGGIVAPKARDRLLELIEREQLPSDVRDTLAGALTGDLRRQQLLFQAMLDTWPRLQKNINEVLGEVCDAPWEINAWSDHGKNASKTAEEKASLVKDAIKGMKPRPHWGELSEGGLTKAIAYGYFAGHQVCEVLWDRGEKGITPRTSRVLPPRFYGYPYDEEGDDRLMLNRDGGYSGYDYEDFPEHHFLISINGGHPGHAAVAAPLRALTGYWLAAVFGLKWLLQFAQLFGIPFRWAEYSDDTVQDKVCQMLESIGSAGWGAFPKGTKVNFESAAQSAQSLPQGDLLKMADAQADTFILGQTLTTDVGDSGSRALGDVHEKVRIGVMQRVADFVADVYNYQFVPSIVGLNYGNTDELPTYRAKFKKPQDEAAMVQRDRTLFVEMKLPVTKSYIYERYGVPVPDKDSDDLFQPPQQSNGVQGDPATGDDPAPHKTKARLEARDASLTWKHFPEGSGTLGIPRVEMPQIYSGNRAALVNFLKARGIECTKETVKADTLKPTQADYSPEKVMASVEFKGGKRSILVSEDSHVVDGHHQWLGALEKEENIAIIRLGAPITRLLNLAHQMPSTTVSASDNTPPTLDVLASNALRDLTGVTKEWLAPVRPYFERLAALAMSNQVSDEDFIEALQKAQKEMPELFDQLNVEALQTSFENAIGTAVIAGSVSRYES